MLISQEQHAILHSLVLLCLVYHSPTFFFNTNNLEFIQIIMWWKGLQNWISFKNNNNLNIHFCNFKNLRIYHPSQMLLNWFVFHSVLRKNVDQRNQFAWFHKRNIYQGKFTDFMIMTFEGFKTDICETISISRFQTFKPTILIKLQNPYYGFEYFK